MVGDRRNRSSAEVVRLDMLVEIWSDVVCPWCYIGKRRFEKALGRFEHASEVEVRWRSFELDPRAPFRRSGDMASHLAAKYGLSLEQAQRQLKQLDSMAAGEGLDMALADTKPGNTFAAHRLIHLGYSKDPETGAAIKEALLHAYFVDRVAVSEPEELARVAASVGLDPAEVADLLAGDRFGEQVRSDEREAAELGATGVPFFVFDRSFAVPGAQDADTLLAILRRAWQRSHPTLEVISAPTAAVCDGDACEMPT